MSGWSAGVWASLARRPPARRPPGVAAGTAAALVRKLPGVPAAESLRLAGTGHLHAGRLLADAGRRAWWPLLAAGSLVSRRVRRVAVLAALPALSSGGLPRLVDDLAYGVGVWKGVLAEREPAPLLPSFPVVAAAPTRIGGARQAADDRVPSAGVTLRLTVDSDAWQDHVDRVVPPRARAWCPVVKGNGYGFGRAELARVAATGSPTSIAVGTVHELDGVPGGVTAGRC